MLRLPLLADLVDVVLPRECVGCGANDAPSGICSGCAPQPSPFLAEVRTTFPVVAAAEYGGATRAALLRYKERGRRDLVGVLARQLARAVRTLIAATGAPPPAKTIALVPVPSSRAAAAARGGDHVLRLARRAGFALALPTARPLALNRTVQDAAGLGATERARNISAAMTARQCGRGPQPVAVIVDDIVTTGATLREARRALQAAGWPVLGAAVVAATSLGKAAAAADP